MVDRHDEYPGGSLLSILTLMNDYLVSTAIPQRFKERVMKYLCLIYEDETVWQKMPKVEADTLC
jgi:hypothetical protein